MPARRAAFAPTLALTVTLAAGAFAIVMAALLLVDHPSPLPAPLGEQNQDAETALYLAAFAIILPAALVAVPRLADAIAAGANGAALAPLAGLLLVTLAGTLLVVRLSASLPWGDGVGTTLVATLVWAAAAAAALARAAADRAWPALLRTVTGEPAIWASAALLVIGTLLGLTSLRSLSVPALVLGALGAGAVLALLGRYEVPAVPRRWGLAFDVGAALLLLLAVPNLVIFSPESAADPRFAFETGIIQFHQDFLLGPANQLLGGSAVLVDTASQYGVGPIYLMAGWFQLAPIGYGTFGFLDGALTALLYVAAYGLLRIAGAPRPLATAALAIAVIALVLNLPYAVGALPQQGPLRFGLPMLVILALVAGARWPRRAGAARAAALAAVGLSSIWALEAFAFTAAVFSAITVLQGVAAAGDRLRWLGRQMALAAAACLAAHLLFAAVTLAASGELPDWGQYLAYLDAFLFGSLGDLTYDFSPWSPGLAVGAAYMASAAAIVLLVVRHRDFVAREWTALVALTGTTAYGITLFSYFVDRSVDTLLLYVALPALLTAALWLSLLLRQTNLVPARTRAGGLACVLAVAVLVLAAAWPSVDDRFPQSALAHAFPRGKSLRDAVERLWHPPPLDPRAAAGERLVEDEMPDRRHVPVLIEPDLGTEILIRSGRANELPFGDPWEDSFVPDERLPALREAVADLRPADRLLTDEDALDLLPTLPTPRSSGLFPAASAAGTLALLQITVLRWIDRRFELQPVAHSPGGLVVVRLAPRR